MSRRPGRSSDDGFDAFAASTTGDTSATMARLREPYNEIRRRGAEWLVTMGAHLRERRHAAPALPALEAVYGRSVMQQPAVLEVFMLGLTAFFKDPDQAPLVVETLMLARVLNGSIQENIEFVRDRTVPRNRKQRGQLIRQLAQTDEYMDKAIEPRLTEIRRIAGF